MTSSRVEPREKKILVDRNALVERLQSMGNFLRLNLKLSHKGLILVSVPLFFELLFLGVLATLLNQAEMEKAKADHSRQIVSHCNTLVRLLYDAGTTIAGLTLTGSKMFSERYEQVIEQIPQEFHSLNDLVKTEPARLARLKRCENVANTAIDLLGDLKRALDEGDRSQALLKGKDMSRQFKSIVDQLITEMQQFVQEETRLQRGGEGAEEKSKRLVKGFLLVGIFFNIFVAFAVAIFFSKEIAARLDGVTENTRRLARGDQLNPPMPGSDEIAHLDRVFHDMAVALAEAARKERAVIENAVDVICSIDGEGKFTNVSPASLKLWGHTPEELIGRRFTDLVVPEDLSATTRAFNEIMIGRSALPFENVTLRQDGSQVNVLWSAFWSESEKSMFCVAHDITERKEAENALRASEARVRQIIDSMPVGLVVVDGKGIIESVNPSMEQIFEYGPEELIGKHLITIFEHGADQDPDAFMQDVYERSLGHMDEREAVKMTGEIFPTQLSLTAFETLEGERFLANIIDLTELREVERLKREFVSTVSHELRTPLTAIRGSLTLITAGAAGELSDQMRKVVTIAERNTIRLIGLINDLLDLEKLEAGKLEMNFEDTALANVIERSVESVRAFGDQHAVSFEAATTDLTVRADGDRLVQVLINLISNAVKFSPRGTTVTIGVKESPGVVEVSVTDRGRGIPEKYRSLLFQRFQQVEVLDAKKRGGTGLGLAICKAIVEQHQGTIGVESEEGKGSTFWFRIPATDKSKEIVA